MFTLNSKRLFNVSFPHEPTFKKIKKATSEIWIIAYIMHLDYMHDM
jgi:hypothetical protein